MEDAGNGSLLLLSNDFGWFYDCMNVWLYSCMTDRLHSCNKKKPLSDNLTLTKFLLGNISEHCLHCPNAAGIAGCGQNYHRRYAANGIRRAVRFGEVCEYRHISLRTLQNLQDMRRRIPFTSVGEGLIIYPESGIQEV